MNSLDTLINDVLDSSGYKKNPYFTSLRDGSFAKDDFIETQLQFYFAVVFFARPMAALAAKIPTPELRVEVLRNVWEEHGEGESGRVHGSTFVELLSRLGSGQKDIDKRVLWPELRAFNSVLTATCVLDEYLIGVATLGIIERMFAEISAWIGRSIVERGWLKGSELIHYTLHEELDLKHSRDFFDILEKSWSNSEQDRYAIEQGLMQGAYIFNRLYQDLSEARKRRKFISN